MALPDESLSADVGPYDFELSKPFVPLKSEVESAPLPDLLERLDDEEVFSSLNLSLSPFLPIDDTHAQSMNAFCFFPSLSPLRVACPERQLHGK